jgi:adenylate cyclase
MALVHIHAGISFSQQPNIDELKRAEISAQRALELDPENADAHAALANSVGPQGEHDRAIMEARRALSLEPSHAWAYGVIGAALTFSGRPDQAISYLDRCIQLDRGDAMTPTRMVQRVVAYYLSRSYREAVKHGEAVIAQYPDLQLAYRWLAAAGGQLGWIEHAEKTLEKARSINPEAYKNYSRKLAPWMHVADHEHLLDGLYKAGWKEDA